MPGKPATHLIIVDVGNSRMKIGRVTRGRDQPSTFAVDDLPVPDAAIDLAIDHATGGFDETRLAAWCDEYSRGVADWMIASVHRGAADRLAAAVTEWATRAGAACAIRRLTYRDVPLEIRVDQPERVGIDRLLAAFAADRAATAARQFRFRAEPILARRLDTEAPRAAGRYRARAARVRRRRPK